MIRFSPSANRSGQLEQLINLMMEADPARRPSAQDILLHPRLQCLQTPSPKPTCSPIVERFNKSLQLSGDHDTILISPRIVLSAQK